MRGFISGLLIFVGMALAACSSVTLDPRKSEFWIGGTVDATDRARLARADSAKALSGTHQTMYLNCIESYALTHAKSSAAPSDIADAAQASCGEDAFIASNLFRESDTLRIAALHLTPGQQIAMRDRIEADVAELDQKTREHGRQLAIKTVIENRP